MGQRKVVPTESFREISWSGSEATPGILDRFNILEELVVSQLTSQKPMRSWRRLILGCTITVLFFTGVFVGIGYYVRWQADRDLESAIAEADQVDPHWRSQDAQGKSPQSSEQNDASLIEHALTLLPDPWPSWDDAHFADENDITGLSPDQKLIAKAEFGASIWRLPRNVRFNDQQLTAVDGELRRAANAIAALERLSDSPQGQLSGFETDIPTIETLLRLKAIREAQQQQVAKATHSCRTLLHLAWMLGEGASTLTQEDRWMLREVVCDTVEHVLGQVELTAADLGQLRRAFAKEETFPALQWAIRGSRLEMDNQIGSSAESFGDSHRREPSILNFFKGGSGQSPETQKRLRAANHRLHNRAFEMTQKPLHLQKWDMIVDRQPVPADTSSAVRYLYESNHRVSARVRSAIIALASESFRIKNNRWPASVDELAPEYLAQIPLDPYDGVPLRMKSTKDGLVVYSIGENRMDDGGRLEFNADATQAPSDIGIRLWNPTERGQAALPPVTLRNFLPEIRGSAFAR